MILSTATICVGANTTIFMIVSVNFFKTWLIKTRISGTKYLTFKVSSQKEFSKIQQIHSKRSVLASFPSFAATLWSSSVAHLFKFRSSFPTFPFVFHSRQEIFTNIFWSLVTFWIFPASLRVNYLSPKRRNTDVINAVESLFKIGWHHNQPFNTTF